MKPLYKGKTLISGVFFEAINLVKDGGYDGFRLWRKIPGLDEWFMHFIDDVQVKEIVNHNLCSNVNGHIGVEHGVESKC